jgi:hypothetical protein
MTTPNDSTFPQRLLAAPPVERYEYFANWRVVHPKLIQAKDEVLQAIRYAGDSRVIHLFGCTGVGKTTLRLWVEKILLEEAWELMEREPDAIPIASVVTPPPDQGPFNWRDVYVQTMHALGEPKSLIAQKGRHCSSAEAQARLQFIPEGKLAVAPILPRQELRLAMTGCLHMRQVKVLFYDDAQHFQTVTKAQRLQDQMDNLKWTADVTGTKIVLVGTYDLLNLIDLSGQLARRSASIHFARYHASEKEEFKQFTSVVYAFQRHLPFAEESGLVDRCEYLYERCLGCVGLLKDWLVRALAQALEYDEKRLTEERLEACTDVRKLVAVAKEAVVGERRVYAVDGLYAELQGLLKSASHFPTPVAQPGQLVSTRKPKGKPGQRAAKRDPVGPIAPGVA